MSWWLGTYPTNVKKLAGGNHEKEIIQPNQTAAFPWAYQTQTARNRQRENLERRQRKSRHTQRRERYTFNRSSGLFISN